MECLKVLPAALVIAAAALACMPVEAQTDPDHPAPYPSHVRNADQRPMPFPPGSETPESASPQETRPLEFLLADRMSQQDRDLAAKTESAIGERAGVAGLEFNPGKWSYQQVVCSALPDHLFIEFTRNNGIGDVSVFSASIPRGDLGQVRVIPIQRRGYSLFSPAPVNAMTVSAFNHIRAEEHPVKAPAWLATGLCYAALAGAHPQIGPPEETAVQKLPAAPTGKLMIPLNGGAVISFKDVSAVPRPMQWTMTFDGKGKLLKATHSAAQRSRKKAVQRKAAEVQGKSVQSTDPDAKATLIK
ncbi:MAG: hypothetical protein ABSE51_21390 [Terracidiphilus sp.]|jgi:hypothetical protein